MEYENNKRIEILIYSTFIIRTYTFKKSRKYTLKNWKGLEPDLSGAKS